MKSTSSDEKNPEVTVVFINKKNNFEKMEILNKIVVSN